MWSWAECYTDSSVCDKAERGPGVLGAEGVCEEKASEERLLFGMMESQL